MAITDQDAMEAGFELAKLEGIIPAIESSHALAALKYLGATPEDKVVVGLSGRGDKDLATYMKWM
jgi:tryptophan synthase beta chain